MVITRLMDFHHAPIMAYSRFPIFLINSLAFLTTLLVLSCKKVHQDLQVNSSVPQNNGLISVEPNAFSGVQVEFDEIFRLIKVKNNGFVFLARTGNKWYFGKLSELGYTKEYLIALDYNCTDFALDTDFKGSSYYVYISGYEHINSGKVCVYSTSDGSLLQTYKREHVHKFNAILFLLVNLFRTLHTLHK